jgi:hypothetical protein
MEIILTKVVIAVVTVIIQAVCLYTFKQNASVQNRINSVVLVRKRTIPTERPPLVGEVSANFSRYRVLRDQRNGSPRPLISVF